MDRFSIPLEQRVLGELILAQVERHPDKPYLSFLDETWTYAAFLAESQALAHGLKALGVGPHARVALVMNNRSEFMAAYWAIAFLNAVIVPVNPGLRGEALGYMLRDAGACVAVVEPELLPVIQALAPADTACLQGVVVLDQDGERTSWGALWHVGWRHLTTVYRGRATLCEPARFDDLHMVSYTSGTTGLPKGTMMSYAQGVQTSQTCIHAVGIVPDDVIYAPLPLFHGMSRTMGTVPALLLGAHAHIAPRFSASRFWHEVKAAQATVAVTIFTIPPTLKNLPPCAVDREHRVRVMFNAHHDREFEERFGTRIVEAHGMTEVGITVYSPYPERREGAAGRPAPDWDVRLVDESDRSVAVGQTGEMVVRPRLPSIMMQGYLNKPEQTAAATRNLWFHTGDFMRADADGFLYFAGRKKERIRRRGENISAFEIEACADGHPSVVESAAVAYPAGDGEDDVRLVVVAKAGVELTPDELAAWLDERLARFMRPRYIEFVERLPKTGSGKLEKYRIADSELSAGCWDREARRAQETAHA